MPLSHHDRCALGLPMPEAGARAPTGHAGIDRVLDGGLARACVHEMFAIDPADASCASGFAAMLAMRLGGGIVWLREDGTERRGGGLHVAGLAEIGIDPARLILALLPDPLAVLRAAADVVRSPEVGVAIVELWRNPRTLDLTATRRLALAAETSGVGVLLLRIEGTPAPSAARTRWIVQSAASRPLEANAPGGPALDLTLDRQRGRPAGQTWRVEWDRDRAVFIAAEAREPAPAGRVRPAALPGAVVPLPAHRPAGVDVPIRRSGTG